MIGLDAALLRTLPLRVSMLVRTGRFVASEQARSSGNSQNRYTVAAWNSGQHAELYLLDSC